MLSFWNLIPAVAGAEIVNLAPIHGVAIANDSYPGLDPHLAIDANWDSNWAASGNGSEENPYWLRVDLQKRYKVDKIVLVFSHNPDYPGMTNIYNLYNGNDGTNWNLIQSGTLVDSTDPGVYVTTIPLFDHQVMQYLKYEVVGGTHWAGIFETEIWGKPNPVNSTSATNFLLMD
ncbi:MAG: discoidin domain-containing protein [Deltaproteobacteria bacterium]|nr:discoidin domain-containing protein [Deltaproteobacteria bacterium]